MASNSRYSGREESGIGKLILVSGIIFIIVGVCGVMFLYSKEASKKRAYKNGILLMEKGEFDEAIENFQMIKGYGDADEKIIEATNRKTYSEAEAALSAGDYETAKKLFLQLGDFADSKERIDETTYREAEQYMAQGNTDQALNLFTKLGAYSDSAKRVEEIVDSIYGLNIGDVYKFGSYEQDNNTKNGKEDIEWRVLAKEGDRILVISKYALDCRQYNSSLVRVTWETSSLREWLNGTFLNAAFSEDERAMIPGVNVSADNNPKYGTSSGNNTTDKVFLLSIQEVEKYFSSDNDRQCKGTAYCYAQGAFKARNGNCWWWLRSSGINSFDAAGVSDDGSVDSGGYSDDVRSSDSAVRPALWIDLGS